MYQSWAAPLEIAARKLGLQIQPSVQVLARDGVEDAFTATKQQRADAVSVVLGGPTFEYCADVDIGVRLARLRLQFVVCVDGTGSHAEADHRAPPRGSAQSPRRSRGSRAAQCPGTDHARLVAGRARDRDEGAAREVRAGDEGSQYSKRLMRPPISLAVELRCPDLDSIEQTTSDHGLFNGRARHS